MHGSSGPDFRPSRRQIVAGAISSGFALAVQPVTAETLLTTDAAGLDASDIKLPTSAGEIPGYVARPAQGKDLPVVLVVHEIFGVHEHIKDVCRRLAKDGYYAIAPDLFVRQGDVTKLTDFGDIRAIVAKAPDAQVMSDLDATVAFARKDARASSKKLGITGFCWGGRSTWLYSAHSTALKAGVAWYGRLVGDRDALHPKHAVDVAGELRAPVLGLYGGQDQGIPLDTVEQMKKALAAGSGAAKKSAFQVYPTAGHAFFADYRPSFQKEAAEDGYKRMREWFKTHGVA
jgi:carboxymethylenebutenolidase